MNYSIREMRKEEYSLLGDFLYEAIYIPDGTAAPPKSVIACPELQVYIADFGNSKHDKALIAEVDGNIVGAIWARIMNDYGHIDDNTPSLAMSVLKAYRGMGIGTSLLTQMMSTEKAAGYAKLSLSVQKDNYAVSLYYLGQIQKEMASVLPAPLFPVPSHADGRRTRRRIFEELAKRDQSVEIMAERKEYAYGRIGSDYAEIRCIGLGLNSCPGSGMAGRKSR